MKKSANLSTEAWLLRGVYSIPGVLRLAKGRLCFTAHSSGNFGSAQLRKLESETDRIGLAKQLGDGEHTAVFDVPLSDVQDVTFPWYYFSGGVKVSIAGVRYRFGFDEPSNAKMSGEGGDVIGEISKARRSGKAWKAVLLDRSSSSSV